MTSPEITTIVVQDSVVTVVDSGTQRTAVVREAPPTIVTPAPASTVTVVDPQPDAVDLIYPVGPPGPAGPAGPQGPAGPSGAAGYPHVQAIPSATWTIDHGLGFYPNVTVIDTLGEQAFGEITYPTINRVVLTFSAAFAGTAYLS